MMSRYGDKCAEIADCPQIKESETMATKPVDAVVAEIVRRFKSRGYSQVENCKRHYNKFGYLRETAGSVYVSREKGQDTPIPFSKISIAIEAVRKDREVYSAGPTSLRKHGITHITSPIWSLLHMLTLEELIN